MSSEPPAAGRPAAASTRWRTRLVMVMLLAVALPVAASILYTFSPLDYGFYPRCMFHQVTGWHCPGCGATRSLYSLLHGDVAQALAYNALFVVACPFLVAGGLRIARALWMGPQATPFPIPGWVVKFLLAVFIAYWLVRNVDVYPFTLLAPHKI